MCRFVTILVVFLLLVVFFESSSSKQHRTPTFPVHRNTTPHTHHHTHTHQTTPAASSTKYSLLAPPYSNTFIRAFLSLQEHISTGETLTSTHQTTFLRKFAYQFVLLNPDTLSPSHYFNHEQVPPLIPTSSPISSLLHPIPTCT